MMWDILIADCLVGPPVIRVLSSCITVSNKAAKAGIFTLHVGDQFGERVRSHKPEPVVVAMIRADTKCVIRTVACGIGIHIMVEASVLGKRTKGLRHTPVSWKSRP